MRQAKRLLVSARALAYGDWKRTIVTGAVGRTIILDTVLVARGNIAALGGRLFLQFKGKLGRLVALSRFLFVLFLHTLFLRVLFLLVLPESLAIEQCYSSAQDVFDACDIRLATSPLFQEIAREIPDFARVSHGSRRGEFLGHGSLQRGQLLAAADGLLVGFDALRQSKLGAAKIGPAENTRATKGHAKKGHSHRR
jgi:hypothetical protein